MQDTVSKLLGYVFVVVMGLLPIMNPLSTLPLFLGLTRRMGDAERNAQALRTCLYAFGILTVFLLFGNAIIAFFSISLAGIRVAGGIIILIIALRMLLSGEGESAEIESKPPETIKPAKLDYSFSPLAMPSLSGPGSIAVVMAYGSEIPGDHRWLGYAVVLTGVAITTLIAYIALRGAGWLSRFLGEHGIQAVTKIMGFLLTCVAVQFIASGIHGFIEQWQ